MKPMTSQEKLKSYDAIVVGGGIVGLACALALAQQGFKLALVESGQAKLNPPAKTDPFDAKIVAITRSSEHFFQQLGVWGAITQIRSCPYQQMQVWDSAADGKITFSASEFFEPNLGHMIEQQVILVALWQALKEQPNVDLFTQTELQNIQLQDKGRIIALSDGQNLKTTLLIAADGANSCARKLCQISSQGWDYQQSALVAIVQGAQSHQFTAFQRFAPDGPLALLPLADPHQCAVVWTTATENAQNLLAAAELSFNTALQRECDAVMGEMTLKSRRWIFPLHTHHAKHYVLEHFALMGDAAHTLHPLAGQGVNLGLLDAQALTQVVIRAKNKRRDYGTLTTLRRYERQRRFHNQSMIWAMECFKRGFASQNPLIQYWRNTGLNWVDRQNSLKQWFAKVALGTWSPLREEKVISPC